MNAWLLQVSYEFAITCLYGLCFSGFVAFIWIVTSRQYSWIQQWRHYWIVGLICAVTPGFFFLMPELDRTPALVEFAVSTPGPFQVVSGNIFQDSTNDPGSFIEPVCLGWLVIFLVGCSIKALGLIMNYLRLRQVVLEADMPTESARAAIDKVLTSSVYCKNINNLTVLTSHDTDSPFVSGVLKPQLVLPYEAPDLLNDEQLKLVIEHELVHLQHRDPLLMGLARWTCVLFWFNPFVKTLFYRLQLAAELSCDAKVLSTEPGRKQAYMEAILKVLGQSQMQKRVRIVNSYTTLINRRIDMMKRRMNHIVEPVAIPRMSMGLISTLYFAALSVLLLGLIFKPALSLAQTAEWKKPLGEIGRVSSKFGVRTDPFTRRDVKHNGVDFAAPEGTLVYAVADGVIQLANEDGAYGKMITVEHAQGILTRYAQLDEILVMPGKRITQGEVIGLVGASGRATGPHLHFEVLVDGKNVDPATYLPGSSPDK